MDFRAGAGTQDSKRIRDILKRLLSMVGVFGRWSSPLRLVKGLINYAFMRSGRGGCQVGRDRRLRLGRVSVHFPFSAGVKRSPEGRAGFAPERGDTNYHSLD